MAKKFYTPIDLENNELQNAVIDGADVVGLYTPKRTIVLSGAGGWPSTTSGCTGPVKLEYSANRVNMVVLDFAAGAQSNAEWTVLMPGNYDGGTITAVFVWSATAGSAGNTVIWGLQGRALGDGDAIDQAFGTAQEVSDTLQVTNTIHISAASSVITVGGTPAANKIVQFRAYRKGAGESLAGTAKLIEVQLLYGLNAYTDG